MKFVKVEICILQFVKSLLLLLFSPPSNNYHSIVLIVFLRYLIQLIKTPLIYSVVAFMPDSK